MMKRLLCRIWCHKLDWEMAHYLGMDVCERCGMEDPPLCGLWWLWCDGKRVFWRWYSWLFIPCRWCGRFDWDPRGHKQGDGTNDDDCCIPF